MAAIPEKVTFTSAQGHQLVGRMEKPAGTIRAFAIFAHCFTCSKNVAAATGISRALAKSGIAVLRFDFTGLGNSEGDFANTNFSSNIEDLVAAADFLEKHHQAPQLLIGHSLGGAAVLAAASKIPSSKAIVTIGAPFGPEHLIHHFREEEATIREEGKAEVVLGGRAFTVKKQFLDDLEGHQTGSRIAKLRKALLIFHAPLDQIVSIEEAAKIYQHAQHPKSFISLEGADHLLTNKKDSQFVANLIAPWIDRFLPANEVAEKDIEKGVVRVRSTQAKFTQNIHTQNHHIIGDEPKDFGGDDLGPSPYELLLASLGTCTAMTLGMYARRKEIDLTQVEIDLSQSRIHAQDCVDCESEQGSVTLIERTLRLEGDLTSAQRQRLLEIADRCPVHRSLTHEIKIRSKLAET